MVYKIGNDWNDTLAGTYSNDTIEGRGGNDVLRGEGGTDVLRGEDGNDTLWGGWGQDMLEGGDGNDVLWGEDESDSLSGGLGNDSLTGGSGSDILNGGAGADTMSGGSSADTYYVDDAGDVVAETYRGPDPGDLVISSLTFSLVGIHASHLTLSGAANLNGTGNSNRNLLNGNDGNNFLRGLNGNDSLFGGLGIDSLEGNADNDILDGGVGADTMRGGSGNDTYYIDDIDDVVLENSNEGSDWVYTTRDIDLNGTNIEHVWLTGSADAHAFGSSANNGINGNSGANVLDGRMGADGMFGGGGNDTYYVDNLGDQVIERDNEGIDLVYSQVDFALTHYIKSFTNYVESLTLVGTDHISGTGNQLANLLTGNSGNNTLNGLGGADTMLGGAGSDAYFVDHTGDVASELLNGGDAGGRDKVIASVSYTLGAYLEWLTLTGTAHINATGNNLDNLIRGNGGNNILNGMAGADDMQGRGGDDTYYIDHVGDRVSELLNGVDAGGIDIVLSLVSHTMRDHFENLTLMGSGDINGIGNALDNVLQGNSGNNVLDGGRGGDSLYGGAGDDTYYLDHIDDRAMELVGGQDTGGFDRVYSTVSYRLGSFIENLSLRGSDNVNATGNGLDNVLYGNSGNNELNGLAGADRMYGSGGNDTYYVDDSGDRVIETFNDLDSGGLDRVFSSVSYTLGKFVENLSLTGSADIDGTGNNQDNILIGNSGDNVLNGRIGTDYLRGDDGADRFVFDWTGVDVITDFSAADGDTIDLTWLSRPTVYARQVDDHVVVYSGQTFVIVYNAIATDAEFQNHILTTDGRVVAITTGGLPSEVWAHL